ncbi:DNA primase [Guyparkeria hydrothermalis]|uniref:DNA primase n=1 Tax=Guyparkeria hydrothermalis TaxID=923 RepID=UPI002020AD2E|nr:DNA primase [Guyparkeria hydrothermalis]MCL7745313.1 DNA primase [Guyparkeria hydrothermalis]
MSRIPEAFVEEVVSRSDIVEVIGARVPLKKKGKEFAACCPFHQEKTPSFYVTPEKQFYHCFGCGVHGNVVGFLMEYDHLDFPTAIEHLAGRLGLEIPREKGDQEKLDRIGRLRQVTAVATDWFRGNLKRSPEAIDFLKQRGLTGETAARFALGFAPAGNHVEAALGGRATPEELVATGLLIQRDNGDRYDRFRGRVIFPIRDPRGHVIGFGGRVIGAGEPKYLNSPETELFHKGYGVYGLYESRQVDQRPDQLIVVEGYMDVILLAQNGVAHAVATLGTATTAEQLTLLFRQTDRLVFCFDGDDAGRRAAVKALSVALPLMQDGRDLRFAFLPEGEDPDSYIRAHGKTGFDRFVEQEALGFDRFLTLHLDESIAGDDTAARARKNKQAHQLIERMPPGSLRRLTERQVDRHHGLFGKPMREAAESSGPTAAKRPPPSRSEEHIILRLLLAHPRLIERVRPESVWHEGRPPAVIARLLADALHPDDRQAAEAQELAGIENEEIAATMLSDILEKRRRREALEAKKRQLRSGLTGDSSTR